jgi:hypothetical protein
VKKLKAGVIKIGSRISFNSNDTSGGNGEARSIIRMLELGGCAVKIFTKILKKDNLLSQYEWADLGSDPPRAVTNDCDVLIVLNGNLNFFGGAEDKAQLYNYQIINEFNGSVIYIYCDPALTLKQVWPSVKKKSWAYNWTEKQVNIVRDDIIYLSQPYATATVLENFGRNEIIPAKVQHFPFEQFPCLHDPLHFNPSPMIDLSYGGTMRGGKRVQKMLKFYFDHPADISVEMFGKITADDFKDVINSNERLPTFTGPVKYAEMHSKMNQAMAHCVIGDPYYEEINDIPQRAYESIWSSVVTFVDSDMDKLRRIYGRDKVLSDFLYVKTKHELSEKIQLLKNDRALREQIIADQFAAIDFNPEQYALDFVESIRDFL